MLLPPNAHTEFLRIVDEDCWCRYPLNSRNHFSPIWQNVCYKCSYIRKWSILSSHCDDIEILTGIRVDLKVMPTKEWHCSQRIVARPPDPGHTDSEGDTHTLMLHFHTVTICYNNQDGDAYLNIQNDQNYQVSPPKFRQIILVRLAFSVLFNALTPPLFFLSWFYCRFLEAGGGYFSQGKLWIRNSWRRLKSKRKKQKGNCEKERKGNEKIKWVKERKKKTGARRKNNEGRREEIKRKREKKKTRKKGKINEWTSRKIRLGGKRKEK